MVHSFESSLTALDERRLLTGVYVARLSIGIALAIAATAVRSTAGPAQSPLSIVLLVVGVPLAFTVGSLLWQRFRDAGTAFFSAQVVHDLLLVSSAVVLTGGVQSEFAYLYLPLIAVAGLLVGSGATIATALACMAVYLGIAWIQIEPIFTGMGATIELPNVSGRAGAIVWGVALIAIVLLAAGIATAIIARRMRLQRERLDELEMQLADARIDAQDILNTVESGIVSINADEQIDFINYTARAQLGVSGMPQAGELSSGTGGAAMLYDLLLDTVRDEAEIEYFEIRLPDPSGQNRAYSVTTTVLYDPRGRKKGAAAILKDIEHVKKLEELARQADRHKAVAELAAGLAHEIRNPLAAIRSSVELIGEDGEDDADGEDSRLMTLIVRETDRLSRLIGDFMAFSRTSLKTRERVDLAAVVEDAIEVERAVAGGESAPKIVFIPSGRAFWVEGDFNLLKQVVINLLANARGAVNDEEDGRVDVKLGGNPNLPGIERAAGPYVAMEIRDNGVGIPRDVRDRIFDPFFTTRPSGYGMGLAIVHRIVDLHGGMVWVESEPGKGSTFRLAFPRAE